MPDQSGRTPTQRNWLAVIRAGQASVAGVAQHLGVDVQELIDCSHGRHCTSTAPECAAAARTDPCSTCCTCGAPR